MWLLNSALKLWLNYTSVFQYYSVFDLNLKHINEYEIQVSLAYKIIVWRLIDYAHPNILLAFSFDFKLIPYLW